MKKRFALLLAGLALLLGACAPVPQEGEVVGAEMGELPTTLVYYPGQKLKEKGGRVRLSLSGGGTREVALEAEMCAFDFSEPGRKRVEVRTAGQSTHFEVLVADRRLCKAESVQEAVDEAEDGDILWLTQGCYHEQLVIDGKRLIIVGDGRGALFMGPKKYEELAAAEGVSALILLRNGAKAELRNVKVYPEARKVRGAENLAGLRFAGIAALLGSELRLAECTIRGFEPEQALFWDEGSAVRSEKLQCRR